MIGPLTIVLIFALSLGIALRWGVAWAYVGVYLPTLVLLGQVPPVVVPHLVVAAPYAPIFGILLAMPLRGESLRFRVCSIDVVVVLLIVSAAITGYTTEFVETAVNVFRNEAVQLAGPYLLARVVFKDWRVRRGALRVLTVVMAIVSVAALVEVRLTPYFYLHVLQRLGMNNGVPVMSYVRFGLFRVSGPTSQPIFFGNMCLVILGLVTVLARTSGARLSSPAVATTLLATLGCVGVSLSYTPYLGLAAGLVGLVTLVYLPFTRRFLLPATLVLIAAAAAYTYKVANEPLPERTYGELGDSYWIRKLIIHQSWGIATTAGPFGYGLQANFHGRAEEFNLDSVDNTYMQFTMTRGWVYTGLWLSLGTLFAFRASRAFGAMTDPETQVFPLAVCTATVLGLMASMYTVFAGNTYAIVWLVLLGLGNTLVDAVLAGAEVRTGAPAGYPLRPPTVRLPGVTVGGRPALAGGAGLARRA